MIAGHDDTEVYGGSSTTDVSMARVCIEISADGHRK
jgi:hypothetical protein